jgi:hypothetical protein
MHHDFDGDGTHDWPWRDRTAGTGGDLAVELGPVERPASRSVRITWHGAEQLERCRHFRREARARERHRHRSGGWPESA